MSELARIKEYISMFEEGFITETEYLQKVFLISNDRLCDILPPTNGSNQCGTQSTPNEVSNQCGSAKAESKIDSTTAIVTMRNGKYFVEFITAEGYEVREVCIGGLTLGATLESLFNPPKTFRTEKESDWTARGNKPTRLNPKGQLLDIDLSDLGL